MTRVFLSLGSNLGDREKNLREAVSMLRRLLEGMRVSSIYETEPLCVTDQPLFLNCAVSGYVRIDARELLTRTKGIERDLGRDLTKKGEKGPRVIDIDILLFDEFVLKDDDLILPHPGIMERKFVLMPLAEIAPDLMDPAKKKLYSEYIPFLSGQIVELFKIWQD